MRALNLDFLCAKYPFVKKLTEKKKQQKTRKLYKWCILIFNTHRKKTVKKVLTFSHLIFLANQTQTSLIYCYCLSLYDCLLQFLFTYRFFGLRYPCYTANFSSSKIIWLISILLVVWFQFYIYAKFNQIMHATWFAFILSNSSIFFLLFDDL